MTAVDRLALSLVAGRVQVMGQDPDNRRLHVVELTAKGDAAFHRLRNTAVAFDNRLRIGLSESDVNRLRELLERLQANVAPADG